MKNIFRISFVVRALLKLVTPFLAADWTIPVFLRGIVVLLSLLPMMGKSIRTITTAFLCVGCGLLLAVYLRRMINRLTGDCFNLPGSAER